MGVKSLRSFIRFVVIIFLLAFAWNFASNQLNQSGPVHFLQSIKNEVQSKIESGEVEEAFHALTSIVFSIIGVVEDVLDDKEDPEKKIDLVKSPNLKTPDEHVFSIYNIEIGDAKDNVEKILGTPKRSSLNEYGKEWFTYHENFHNFVNVMYDENQKVIGLYSNQDMISSTVDIKLGSSKEFVHQQLGAPLTRIQKGFVFYQLQEDADYDIFQLDESYVTIFYDQHEDNTVTSIQIIDEELEQAKTDFYTKASDKLKEGFEYQMFDLTNATRVQHNLPTLTWDDHVKETAREHSADMAKNHYFDHTNLEGQSPFDRMKEDDLFFTLAGENLAYGQFSSIFAHEGLMNSMGHRKNILQSDFEYLGIGVAFNAESHPYYTQNYYAK